MTATTGQIKLIWRTGSLASDVTLTLPSHSGTLVSTGATGTDAQITPDMLQNSITAQTGDFLGSATSIPRIKFDEAGCITETSSVSISTTMNISAGTGSGSIQIGTNTLDFDEGTGVSTSITGNSVTFAIGQDVSTTSNVTFDDITASGTLEVEGGELKVWSGGQTTSSGHYRISFPKGSGLAENAYKNIQITNDGRGLSPLDGANASNHKFENVLIGYNMPTGINLKNVVMGSEAGGAITGSFNTILDISLRTLQEHGITTQE